MRTFLIPSFMIASLLLAACGSDNGGSGGGGSGGTENTVTAPIVSGTRLRAKVDDAGGEAIAFIAWHDTQIDDDCAFYSMADGVIRCLPGAENPVYFADAGCTDPVAIAPPCGDAPPQGHALRADPLAAPTCEQQWTFRAYTIGAAKGAPSTTYYKDSSGGCNELGSFAQFAVSEMAAGGFVEGSVVREARGPALEAQLMAGSDGARAMSPFAWDTQRGVACFPLRMEGAPDEYRCLPSNMDVLGAPFFSDASCATGVAAWQLGAPCADPSLLATSNMQGEIIDLFAVGAEVPASSVYQKGDSCAPVADLGDAKFFAVGAAVDAAGFAVMVDKRRGSGRVQVNYKATEAGLQIGPANDLASEHFFDSQESEPCESTAFADGTRRCVGSVHTDAVGQAHFRDAACTQRIVAADTALAAGKPVATLDKTPTCKVVVNTLHALGAKYEGGAVYRLDGASCIADSPDPSIEWHDLGAALPAESLPLITRRVE